jgi:hypothetical protein
MSPRPMAPGAGLDRGCGVGLFTVLDRFMVVFVLIEEAKTLIVRDEA